MDPDSAMNLLKTKLAKLDEELSQDDEDMI